jgi:hypothetical protein
VWWDAYRKEVDEVFQGECWTQDKRAADKYRLRHIRGENKPGLSRDPELIHTGGNSGYQAINLMYHFGVSRIILLGYDMKGQHWHGKHPGNLSNHHDFRDWIKRYHALAADLDIEVINCTPGTALDAFPTASLESVL